jgi:DNA-binding SARP family transcriptional activator
MTTAAQQRSCLPTLTRAFVSAAILAALGLFRPPSPALPSSLLTPLTIETVEGVTLWLLWLAAALLALALLLTPRQVRRRFPIATIHRPHTPPNLPPYGRQPRAQPSSLVIAPPELVPAEFVGAALAEPAPPIEPSMPAQDVVPGRPRISLLGPLTITGAKRSRRGLRARALELIAYLAIHPRPVQRDELLEAFWAGEDPRRTRPRLRQAVRDARRLLGTAIAGEHGSYWLDRAQADVDLDELVRLLATVKTCQREKARALMESALRLFHGEPLAGADYAWSEGEVRRVRATFVDVLEQVARHRLEAGEARAALEAAERGLEVDTLNESLWRLAMEAEGALGLREAVAERYERLRTLLDERLGLEPAHETRLLHRGLLAQT